MNNIFKTTFFLSLLTATGRNPYHAAVAATEGLLRILTLDARPATAHMFIVSPLTGFGIMSLFSTHAPMEERIAQLETLATRTH